MRTRILFLFHPACAVCLASCQLTPEQQARIVSVTDRALSIAERRGLGGQDAADIRDVRDLGLGLTVTSAKTVREVRP